MITKEKIKQEIDRLLENYLEEVYELLKRIVAGKKPQTKSLTKRNFQGKLDQVNIRNEAYE